MRRPRRARARACRNLSRRRVILVNPPPILLAAAKQFGTLHPSLLQLHITMNLTVNETHSQRRQALSAHATGAEASENSICRFVIPGFNLCYYCPNKSNNGERARTAAPSFLKFVIGTLFHKPAPETRNVGLSQGNWREFGGKFVSAVSLLHVPHFREFPSTAPCRYGAGARARERAIPLRPALAISRASNYITGR